ncbi:hypothetical protein EV652_111152 [Kribbella steppae]|uniref:Uncharacterized protein n=1 Tax=Kribbella steppae TaxID=2512223 RepID=A0A4R2H607_9ACTN|nr:hypothetical protein EV652_111152 [Kribbella steppae]
MAEDGGQGFSGPAVARLATGGAWSVAAAPRGGRQAVGWPAWPGVWVRCPAGGSRLPAGWLAGDGTASLAWACCSGPGWLVAAARRSERQAVGRPARSGRVGPGPGSWVTAASGVAGRRSDGLHGRECRSGAWLVGHGCQRGWLAGGRTANLTWACGPGWWVAAARRNDRQAVGRPVWRGRVGPDPGSWVTAASGVAGRRSGGQLGLRGPRPRLVDHGSQRDCRQAVRRPAWPACPRPRLVDHGSQRDRRQAIRRPA